MLRKLKARGRRTNEEGSEGPGGGMGSAPYRFLDDFGT